MRAEEVIATHGNTDFDAFAAMLAARHLYPGAVVAVGSLNRNVRDFYRLHADELGAIVETGRLELDAIKRLVVIEATAASRLGELEPVALDPSVEKALFDHHGETGAPEWVHEEAAVFSTDGALTTTLVGILANVGSGRKLLECGFALRNGGHDLQVAMGVKSGAKGGHTDWIVIQDHNRDHAHKAAPYH